MTHYPLYQQIASLLQAIENCRKSNNVEWGANHRASLRTLANLLPSGAGIDTGTVVDTDASTPEKIVLHTSFHHMDEHGGYDGWTEHTLTVRPSLQDGFKLSIGGRDRNGIKDYLADVYQDALASYTVPRLYRAEREGNGPPPYRARIIGPDPIRDALDLAVCDGATWRSWQAAELVARAMDMERASP